MANRLLDDLVRSIRRLARAPAGVELTDRQLLQRFAAQRNETAFEVLVRRHGALVLGVCLRVLHHMQDAEDAFQATFLVLARKASSVQWRDDVGNWLYAVAYRTALKAKSEAARRRGQESPLLDVPAPESTPDLAWRELRPLLDEEVSRLPEKYRAPVVLCYLEDKTYTEAARILGVAEGTVSSRLARAREKLRTRLVRRGLTLSAGLLGTALAQQNLSAAVPVELMQATIRAAAGKTTVGAVSVHVVALVHEVLQSMFLTKLKIVTAILVSMGIVGGGVGAVSYRAMAARAEEAQAPEEKSPEKDAGPSAFVLRVHLEFVEQRLQARTRELQDANDRIKELEDKLAASQVRGGAALYQGKPVGDWIVKLRDLDPDFRTQALMALGAIAEVDRTVVPVIRDSLKDKSANVRSFAVLALGQIGPDATPMVKGMLKDPSSQVRRSTAQVLVQFGPAMAVVALAEMLRDPDQNLRQNATHWLTQLAKQGMKDSEAKAAVAAIIPALRDPSISVRQYAIQALAAFGPAAEGAVPALMDALDDRTLNMYAITALGSVGPPAKAAVPKLLSMLEATPTISYAAVHQALQDALQKIDPKALKK
jgi:RNA polymerase sigma factor (sigma-70 family)